MAFLAVKSNKYRARGALSNPESLHNRRVDGVPIHRIFGARY